MQRVNRDGMENTYSSTLLKALIVQEWDSDIRGDLENLLYKDLMRYVPTWNVGA